MIDDDELDAIKARCLAATPGPWESYIEGRDIYSASSFILTTAADIEILYGNPASQDFVAAARQYVPLCLAEIERMKAAMKGETLQSGSNFITEKNLARMRSRCEAAAPGPWRFSREDRYADGSITIRHPGGKLKLFGGTDADQEFIVNCRRDVPLLLDAIAELRSQVKCRPR